MQAMKQGPATGWTAAWGSAAWMLGAALAACGGVGAADAAEPAAEAVQGKEKKPNVVVVFCDDLGYGDVGCFGATGYATPAVDRLAKEGMRFTDFYVAQAVCSASRCGLLTGCYPNRLGILGALGPKAKTGLNPQERTLGELFRENGYATAIFGKWHLGDDASLLPTRQGFEQWFGLPYSNDMWPNHPTNKSFPPLPLYEMEQVKETNPDQSQLTGEYTRRAVEFIEKSAKQQKPFFLYLPHTMPHVPLFAGEKFRGTSEKGIFGDVIREIDASVESVLETLDRLKLADETIVIFTSDNGPWLSYGKHAGSAGKLREGKGTSFDGGVRVPCVVRWPGRTPAGSVCHEPLMTIDLLPTFAEILGVPAALPDRPIDGKSGLALIEGKPDAKSPQEAYFFYWGEGLEAVRSGPWKLHFPHAHRSQTGPGGNDGRPANEGRGKIDKALFNVETDVSESQDLLEKHPDVVARLERLAEGMRADLGDALTGRKGTGHRPAGRASTAAGEGGAKGKMP